MVPPEDDRLPPEKWSQGDLLPNLDFLFLFNRNRPLSELAAQLAENEDLACEGDDRIAAARAVMPEDEKLIIASAGCDIDKPFRSDPWITAIRVFRPKPGEDTLHNARPDGRSERFFRLNPAEDWVADASATTLLEKPVLKLFEPVKGIHDTQRLRQFSLWLARRLDRAAFPDVVLEKVVKPIQGFFPQARESQHQLAAYAASITDVFVNYSSSTPNRPSCFLFLRTRPEGLANRPESLELLTSALSAVLEEAGASLVDCEAGTLADISAEAFQEFDRIRID